MFKLPATTSPTREALARLNLLRGLALGLPSGRDVALALGVEPLTDEQLLPGAVGVDISQGAPAFAATLVLRSLRGAGPNLGNKGRHLGPVGGRIVDEVLTGLLDSDPNGYRRRWPEWTPELPRAANDDFTMADLIDFVG